MLEIDSAHHARVDKCLVHRGACGYVIAAAALPEAPCLHQAAAAQQAAEHASRVTASRR